jgi:hypothetical protein
MKEKFKKYSFYSFLQPSAFNLKPLIYSLSPIAYFPYRVLIFVLSSSESDFKYDFHPGHQPMCHFQNLPIKDLGFLSYLALNLHVSQRAI